MNKKISTVLTLLLLIIIFNSCTREQSATSSYESRAKTVTIAIADEGKAELLDANSYNSAMALYSAIYEPLIEYAGKGVYKAGLAQSWHQSADGKSYTFYLQPNTKFSDGSEVTADAVKFSIQRAKFLNKSSTLQTLSNLSSINTPDKYTVELVFNQVSNQVLAELCQPRPLRIMSPNSVDTKKYNGKFQKAIGTGAFMIENATDEQITMLPNPFYKQQQPVNYKIVFKTIQDASSRFLAIKSGDIDIVGGTLGDLSAIDIAILSQDKNFNSYQFAGTMSHFIAFNPENSKLSSPIRQAIASAINVAELSKQNIIGLFPDTVQYVTPTNQRAKTYDVAKAKALFEKAGYQLNTTGYYEKQKTPLAFNLVIQTTEFPEWKEKAEIIEQQLKMVGVNLAIKLVDQSSYYDILWKTKQYDLIFYRTYTDALLPYNFLNSLFANHYGQTGILANDIILTKLLQEYAQTNNLTEQQEIFNAIFKHIDNQSLVIPFQYKDELFITSKKITNFSYSGISNAPIDFATLKVN